MDFASGRLGFWDGFLWEFLLARYVEELGEVEAVRERVRGLLSYARRAGSLDAKDLILMEQAEGELFGGGEVSSPAAFLGELSKALGFHVGAGVFVADVVTYLLYFKLRKDEGT